MLGAYRSRLEEEPVLVVPRFDDVGHHQRDMAGSGALIGGQVVRFNWLFQEIAKRVGYRPRRVSRLQRELLAAEAVRRTDLELLARSAERDGFAGAAVRFFAELERARVEPDRLEEALARWVGRGPRRRYAIEISSLYAAYRERLESAGLVDSELFAAGAVDRLRAEPYRWGRTPVFVYGFDDFTELELDALDVLARRAEADVVVSLPYERGRLAFKAVAPVFEKLRALADREPEELPAVNEWYAPESRAALHHLERRLFEPEPQTADAGGVVTVLKAGGERAEAELVAAEVLKLLRAGTEPGDIAVVYRRPRRYATLVEQVFDAYGIPHSLERWIKFGHTALGRGMLALLRAAQAGGSADDLLAYLRTPGVLRVVALADRLESEVRQEGARSARRAAELFEQGGGFHLGELERIARARGDALVDEVLARLEHLLAGPWRREAHVLRGPELADARAYEAARGALGELRALADAGVRIDLAGVAEALERLEVREGELPDPRRVQVTEPEAVRARRFAAVFACGLQEGEWPAAAPGDPFLSDDDRREIADKGGLALPLRATETVERERYLFYSTLSRAERRVYLSSRYSDEDGNAQARSFFIEDVRDLFGDSLGEPLRRSLSDVTWRLDDAPTSKEWERAAAARGPRREQRPGSHLGTAELADWLAARGGFSASALEAFSECPVRWLVERVLDPNVLEPDPEYMVRGSYAHRVLELTFAELREQTGSMRVRPGNLAQAEKILLQKMRELEHEFPLSPSQTRVRAAVRRLEFDLIRYLRHEAAKDSELEPAEVELKFGFEGESLSLPPLRIDDVEIRGKIDRVDRLNGHALVIDYKSGKNVHGIAKWADRHMLQAPLYMLAVKELMGLEPIGGVYQPLKGDDLRPRGVVCEEHREALGGGYVGTDWKPGDELQRALDRARATVVEVVARMRQGDIHPTPDCCSNGGGCRYPSICREEPH